MKVTPSYTLIVIIDDYIGGLRGNIEKSKIPQNYIMQLWLGAGLP
ncbi:MAG: hypothetical protein ACJAVV_000925 [Alphaproteobacteria bacterium]|jgi:hypothetical protein